MGYGIQAFIKNHLPGQLFAGTATGLFQKLHNVPPPNFVENNQWSIVATNATPSARWQHAHRVRRQQCLHKFSSERRPRQPRLGKAIRMISRRMPDSSSFQNLGDGFLATDSESSLFANRRHDCSNFHRYSYQNFRLQLGNLPQIVDPFEMPLQAHRLESGSLACPFVKHQVTARQVLPSKVEGHCRDFRRKTNSYRTDLLRR